MSHRKQTIIKAVAHLAAYACMFMFVLSPLPEPLKGMMKKTCTSSNSFRISIPFALDFLGRLYFLRRETRLYSDTAISFMFQMYGFRADI